MITENKDEVNVPNIFLEKLSICQSCHGHKIRLKSLLKKNHASEREDSVS